MIEPTPTLGPIPFGSGLDPANLSQVLLRQGGESISPTLIIDGIYVETSWNNTTLPVELASFTSAVNKRNVTLNWATASESNNSGFSIERSDVRGQTSTVWTKIGSVTGNGTTTTPQSYSYTDRNLASGNYNYRLKQTDFNGNFEYFNLSNEVVVGIPASYDLSQNYPNPFNPTTNINYEIPFDGKVSLKIFDMSGKEVASLVNEVKTAGYYTYNFNASSLSSGVYFYSLSANNFTATKKMMLLK
ncbi:MAG: T9SS type A sorting domain-containing protein [Ignavibacteria bacterium]|nr:T9SS type A sorting domain-containing protein [Ignavibacteria bacterium]